MFWNNHEPNVKATIAFLQLLNVKVNLATVDKTLQEIKFIPTILLTDINYPVPWH